ADRASSEPRRACQSSKSRPSGAWPTKRPPPWVCRWAAGPYPVHSRPAFAFSLVLYPPPLGLLLGDWQEINYLDHARGDTNPTRQRGDRRRHALASASVPRWRVGLVWPVFSVPVSMRSLETDRSLGDFRAAGRLKMTSRQRKGGPPGDIMDCLHKIESIGRANQVPQTAQIALALPAFQGVTNWNSPQLLSQQALIRGGGG